jgi:ABC-type antimicrobial peptide transport system permease subunit
LGAMPAALARTTIVAGVMPVAVGVGFGLAAAAIMARAAESLLTGVGTFDPPSYGAAAALMISIATAAGAIATSRIRRLEPIDALRIE